MDDIKDWVEIGGLALVKVLDVKWSHKFSNKILYRVGSEPGIEVAISNSPA